MIRADEVQARIEARVSALTGNMQDGGKFADIIKRKAWPQRGPAGWVLSGGVLGGEAQAMTGLFIQNIAEVVSVVLMDRYAGDASGGKAAAQMTPLVRQVVENVIGWGPDDGPGVWTLHQVELVGIEDGKLIHEINFALNDQLRIDPT